jgi:3-hydroxyisobutyrate dehydrogenase-like beta-hydroxyacid dehydrogenase
MAKLGVEIAKSAAAVAKEVPVVITSLPSPKALDATVKAIVNAKLPRRVVVEASTFTLADKERAEAALRKAGHIMLDSPVSGTGAQAQSKDLVIYASGDTKSIAKLKPMYAAFSRKAYDLGAFGNGSRMKYVAVALLACLHLPNPPPLLIVEDIENGLDPRTIFEMISNGAGNSRVFELRAPMMVRNRYGEATMKCSVWQKDMQVIGDYAKQIGCPTPMFSATLPVYAAALKSGHAEEDTAAVCAVLEVQAGFKRKRGKKR